VIVGFNCNWDNFCSVRNTVRGSNLHSHSCTGHSKANCSIVAQTHLMASLSSICPECGGTLLPVAQAGGRLVCVVCGSQSQVTPRQLPLKRYPAEPGCQECVPSSAHASAHRVCRPALGGQTREIAHAALHRTLPITNLAGDQWLLKARGVLEWHVARGSLQFCNLPCRILRTKSRSSRLALTTAAFAGGRALQPARRRRRCSRPATSSQKPSRSSNATLHVCSTACRHAE